jgi:RsiW-degrading membrane proteinase PrsW (M82 family)
MSQPAALEVAPPRTSRYEWKRLALLVGLVVAMAACGIGVLVWLGLDIGPTALAVGVAGAVIPVPVLVSCFLWLDRYEPEPIKYLATAHGWGACIATAVALVVNNLSVALVKHLHMTTSLVAVTGAPVIEESMKALGPFLLFLLRRRAFSGVVDGIVYCGLSATGFAMVENILYLGRNGYAEGAGQGGVAGGVAGLIGVFFVRIIFSGFAHPLFTAMTGIGLGVAARSADKRVRIFAPIAGLLTAMILHGSWNLMSTLADAVKQPLILLYGYFAVMMPIFLGMVGFALWLRSWEGRLTQRVLPEYVRAGWLTPPEVAALATMGRRLSARTWARRVAGDPGAEAMRGFQFAATRLSLLRDGLRRGLTLKPAEMASAVAEEHALLQAISWYRGVFTGRDPQMPPAVWDGQRYHLTFPDGTVRTLDPPPQPVVPVPVVLVPYYR